jgi:hypothetical protein
MNGLRHFPQRDVETILQGGVYYCDNVVAATETDAAR